jgi:phosphoglycolate phosphatase
VKNSKPNPEGILLLMRKFNKTVDSTVFIGDSWVDAETAVKAGVEFIYYGTEGAPGTRRKKIDSAHTISSMKDLLRMY